tara:strand:+ start:203 stop:397 length:195 start_codon:yes stop_codon:yes gene_type:complete
MELHEKYEIEIDNYIKWFQEDNSDIYGELKWLICSLLNSKHKENIIDVLKTTNEGYVKDSNNKF